MAPTYTYECQLATCGEEYEEVLKIADYKKRTFCPKCGNQGKKTIKLRSSEPTFSDKIYPYYDRALNKVFHSKGDRSSYMKRKGIQESGEGSSTWKQERKLYREWRLGGFDPKIARHALRD